MSEFIEKMKEAWREDRRANNWSYQGDRCGLYDAARWVVWHPGDDTVSLDSSFTVEELEAIVAYIKANREGS